MNLISGEEKVGSTATYSFDCELDDNAGSGALWLLEGGSAEVASGVVTSFTENTEHRRVGTYSVNYSHVPAGAYTLFTRCDLGWGSTMNALRTVHVAPSSVATTTSLVAEPSSIVGPSFVELVATVSGVPAGGLVNFSVGGHYVGTGALDANGRATLRQWFAAAGTASATYVGAPGYEPSTSAPSHVTMVTEVVAPAAVDLVGAVEVGSEVSVALGTWSPSAEDGTTFHYSWFVDDVQVGGNTPTYTPTAADRGKALRVDVTGANGTLPKAIARSAAATVAQGALHGSLAVAGTTGHRAVLGQPLTASVTGLPAGAEVTYVWTVESRTVSTTDTYVPAAADLGHSIHVSATATAAGYATWKNRPQDGYVEGPRATPTVTVAPVSVAYGQDATVTAVVAGPQGGPRPTGLARVTVTNPADGAVTDLGNVSLDAGTVTATASGLAVGSYDVQVDYLGSNGFARAASSGPYDAAVGTGTIVVALVTPVLSVPGSLAVKVATGAVVDVTATGAALPPTYMVREGATVLSQGKLPQDGVLRVTLPVLAPGTHRVTVELPASASTTAVSAEVAVTVAGEPSRITPVPTARLATPQAASRPGQAMELVARDFQPGEVVAFYLHSDPIFLGTAIADADGVARLSAVIPAGAPLGAHTVVATGGESGRWASLPVELAALTASPAGPVVPATVGAAPVAVAAAAGTPAPSGPLATTGSQTSTMLALVWALVLVGSAGVVTARRLRARG